jgi:hypothetical protein
MTHNRRDRFYGQTIEEWAANVSGELPVDAIGLWQIVSFGRAGFDLSGDDLVRQVRRILLALLAKGAKPVVGASDGIHIWTVLDYNASPEATADAIIAEWLSSGENPTRAEFGLLSPMSTGQSVVSTRNAWSKDIDTLAALRPRR